MSRSMVLPGTLFLAVRLVAATAAQAPGPAKVWGHVTDAAHRPIAGATVMLTGIRTGTVTAADGSYTLLTVPGTVTLTASAPGFLPVEASGLRLSLAGDMEQDFQLSAARPNAGGVMTEQFTVDQVDDPVAYLSGPKPEYPADLKARKVEGRVTLRFIVGREGKAETGSVQVVNSTNREFEAAAVAVISGSLFKPARIKGTPVRQIVEQSIRFTLPGGSP